MKSQKLLLIGIFIIMGGCAAERHLRDARAANLAGRPIIAEKYYRRALAISPKLAKDPRFVERFNKTQAQALHEKGRDFARQNAWQEAINTYQKATEIDPSNQAVQDQLLAASPRASDWFFGQGMKLADSGDVDAAIMSLQSAVAFNQDNVKAKTELADLLELRRQRRAKATELYEQSLVLADQNKWAQALAAAKSSHDLQPKDPRLTKQINSIKQRATGAWTARGRALLNEGQLDDAKHAFFSALGYIPNHQPARQGLADIDMAFGNIAQSQGHFGRAMLWYRSADTYFSQPSSHQAIAAMRLKILNTHTINLAFRGQDVPELLKLTQQQFSSHLPDYVRVVSSPDEDYIADIALPKIDINQNKLSSKQATYTYYETRQVPNPRISPLELRLRKAEHRLQKLRHQSNVQCSYCRGAGWIHVQKKIMTQHACPHCNGSGKGHKKTRNVQCQRCHGAGWIHAHSKKKDKQQATCSHCNGSGRRQQVAPDAQCQHCNGTGRIHARKYEKRREKCSHCQGSGRQHQHLQHDINRARRHVSKLRHLLSCEPALVSEQYPLHWIYTITDYAKIGSLSAVITLNDKRIGEMIDTAIVKRSFIAEDSVIANANPLIGLRENHLQLPSDNHIRSRLTNEAAKQLAAQLTAMIASTRHAILNGLAQQQNGANSLELSIAAALMLEASEPKRAKQLLDKLQLPSSLVIQ
jgi:tetratricopeptide (TPR) repeat protein